MYGEEIYDSEGQHLHLARAQYNRLHRLPHVGEL